MPSEPDVEHSAPDFSFDGPVPAKLAKFRNLTGINTPRSLLDDPRPAKNIGIYARVIAEERKTSWQYWFMNGVIESSMMGQIAIGAALTALGASDSSHIAITVLGSANTVVAGLQTYLKGQGLPNRLRQYEFGLRKLREHVEDLERHFSHEDCKLNVNHEIADIAAMYHAVRQTSEDNTPDTYLPMSGAGAKLLAKAKGKSAPSGPSGPEAPAAGPALPAPGAETGPEALAATGKPPTADEVAEAGGAEALKPAADKDAPKDAAADTDAPKPAAEDKPADANGEASADAGPTTGETSAPETETHPGHADATEETPLLKK